MKQSMPSVPRSGWRYTWGPMVALATALLLTACPTETQMLPDGGSHDGGGTSDDGGDGGTSGDGGGGPELPGPRGSVGPDVPLSNAEDAQLTLRVTVQDLTSESVQAACDQAASEGTPVVFLPAGEYVFSSRVDVPGGITLLGEGSATVVRVASISTKLFAPAGDLVRFTRLKLQGADETMSTNNDSYGISVNGKQNVRIDHCELSGFSYATHFSDETTAQVDHCTIHHNPRAGLGYGVAIYSGAYVLIIDNEFSQNRHTIATNGALDWSSGSSGMYMHIPGVRKTHWEFNHNHVMEDDLTEYQLARIDTHPGMDGTFVSEFNVFEELRLAYGIRDGSGLIRQNVFRNLDGASWRPKTAVYIGLSDHNGIPVENAMPHYIRIEDNQFDFSVSTFDKYEIGEAENIWIEGEIVPETDNPNGYPEPPIPRLQQMGVDGVLTW